MGVDPDKVGRGGDHRGVLCYGGCQDNDQSTALLVPVIFVVPRALIKTYLGGGEDW